MGDGRVDMVYWIGRGGQVRGKWVYRSWIEFIDEFCGVGGYRMDKYIQIRCTSDNA